MNEKIPETETLGMPEDLISKERMKIILEMKEIFDKYNSKLSTNEISLEKNQEVQTKIINFKDQMIKEGNFPYQYILFHMLLGSTPPVDSIDGKIRKFIKELYAEYI